MLKINKKQTLKLEFYIYITFILQKYYSNLLPIDPMPSMLFFPSLKSFIKSFILTNLVFGVFAIRSATINGSIKSINILAGEEAKFAPAPISASKKL